MYLKRVFFLVVSIFIIAACTNETQKDPTFLPNDNNRDLELVKLSSDGIISQNPSNQAKEILSNYEEVSGVRAANSKE